MSYEFGRALFRSVSYTHLDVYKRQVADISSVTVKDGLYRYGVALMCLYDSVIGKKSVTHGAAPPFPLSTALRQAGYAARLCCVSSRFVLRDVYKRQDDWDCIVEKLLFLW